MKTLIVFFVAAGLWLATESQAQAQMLYVSHYQPVTVYRIPVVAPVRTAYYAPAPAVAYQPVARVHTRYRPFLGGSVTRVRYGYAPTYYTPAPAVCCAY